MHRNSRMYLTAAAFLALPLAGCADGPTGVGEPSAAESRTLIVHEISSASDFRVFTHAERPDAPVTGLEGDVDCPVRDVTSVHGPRMATKRGSGRFVSFGYQPLPPLNPFCGCPKQPWGGAPAGYTCRLTGSQCDENGRTCSYTCSPNKPPTRS